MLVKHTPHGPRRDSPRSMCFLSATVPVSSGRLAASATTAATAARTAGGCPTSYFTGMPRASHRTGRSPPTRHATAYRGITAQVPESSVGFAAIPIASACLAHASHSLGPCPAALANAGSVLHAAAVASAPMDHQGSWSSLAWQGTPPPYGASLGPRGPHPPGTGRAGRPGARRRSCRCSAGSRTSGGSEATCLREGESEGVPFMRGPRGREGAPLDSHSPTPLQ